MKRSFSIIGTLALVITAGGLYVGSVLAAPPDPSAGATPAAPTGESDNGAKAGPRGGRFAMGHGMQLGFGRGLMGHTLERVAEKLGMTADDLKARLEKGDTMKTIADEKQVSTSDLADYILDPEKDTLAVRVKYGQMTQEQADAAIEQAKQTLTKQMEAPLRQPQKQQLIGISTGTLDRVARKLGTTTDDLKASLQKGQSLKDIAAGKNVSETDLVDLILDPQTEVLAVRVKYGYMTQDEADKTIESLKAQVTKLVETPGNELRIGSGDRGEKLRRGRGGNGAQPNDTPAPSTDGTTSS